MTTTFTKFDALGSCLAELRFDCVDFNMTRGDDGSVSHYTIYLHRDGGCRSGSGYTPTDALSMALASFVEDDVAKVEAAAELSA